jgi:hypothetical protein
LPHGRRVGPLVILTQAANNTEVPLRRLQEMPTAIFCLLWFVLTVPLSLAQQTKRQPGDPVPAGDVGILHIMPAPGQVPSTLAGLENASSLIVVGSIQKTLPPREPSRGSLETDAIVSVTSTLKGAAAKEIVISQRGGYRGDVNTKPAQYSLVRQGEQYILFLTEDRRPTIPQPAGGLSRYLVTGIWAGLFYFEDGRMIVKADEPDPLRKKYQGLTLEQIVAQLKTPRH